MTIAGDECIVVDCENPRQPRSDGGRFSMCSHHRNRKAKGERFEVAYNLAPPTPAGQAFRAQTYVGVSGRTYRRSRHPLTDEEIVAEHGAMMAEYARIIRHDFSEIVDMMHKARMLSEKQAGFARAAERRRQRDAG